MPPPPSFQSTESLWPLGAAASSASDQSSANKTQAKPKRNRQRRQATSDVLPPAVSTDPSSSSASAPQTNRAPSDRSQRGSARGRGRGGYGSAASAPRGAGGGARGGGHGGGGRGMSTLAGSVGRGGHSSAQSSAGDDIGSRVFSRTPFARNGGAGASGSASWRPMHTDSSAQSSVVEGAVEGVAGGAKPPGQKKGKKGKGKEQDKAERLLAEAALKEGEEGGLSTEIMRLYQVQRPSPEAIAARQHLIDELTYWFNQERFQWGHPHNARVAPLEVVPFGSIRFGLSTATSDLDLCLLDPYRPNGFEEKHFSSTAPPRALPDIYNMYRIASSLRRANLTDVNAIADAAVPICKFKVSIDGQMIEADINTNERLGVFNSRLINSYCNLHPLVRPLSVFVKFWAKQRGLNNPSGSPTTFSSYTYILLVISYLQHLDLLPNLQDGELIAQTGTPRNRFFSTPKARMGRGGGKRNKIVRSVGWDVTFVEYDSPPEGYSPAEADLAQLARGFFHYWADEFDMRQNVVSIWNGREPLPRAREFAHQADIDREKSDARKAVATATGVDDAERARQEHEDEAVAAFSQEADAAAVQADEPALDADVAELDAGQQAADERSRPDSRSSSPVEYSEYEEPERWRENLLVVQDPFILTRNTSGNVQPDWVEELRVQMRRARDLIDSSAPISTICLSIASDPDYVPVARPPRAERRKKERRPPKPAREAAKATAAPQELEAANVVAESEAAQAQSGGQGAASEPRVAPQEGAPNEHKPDAAAAVAPIDSQAL